MYAISWLFMRRNLLYIVHIFHHLLLRWQGFYVPNAKFFKKNDFMQYVLLYFFYCSIKLAKTCLTINDLSLGMSFSLFGFL